MPPHRVGFLHRFGLKTGLIHFAILVRNQVWFSRELRECMNPFFSIQFQMSEKEREICEFDMDLKKFFYFHGSTLSNDNITEFCLKARSESRYGF